MIKSFFCTVFLIVSFTLFSQNVTKHKVLKGETITQIAHNYKTTPSEIYKLNPESKNGIAENQILSVPQLAPKPQNTITHIVEPKETLYGLATKYHVKVEAIQEANPNILESGLKVGQEIYIPQEQVKKAEVVSTKKTHVVLPKESLFSIGRLYNVSVEDLDKLNSGVLADGLKVGQVIKIPNKKKTLDGRVRVINSETVFHVVKAKETKYSISKQYGISIKQLETQNPEIINGLIEGNTLAINVKEIEPSNDNEELMIALAEKQVAIEKSKAKEVELENLEDMLEAQKTINKKVLKVNSLKVDLESFEDPSHSSIDKIRLVLEANKNIQDVLTAKMDSLVYVMGVELEEIKNTEIIDVENSKRLERQSYANVVKTKQLSQELKKDLYDNRKIYSGLMSKTQQIALEENIEYKKKMREASKRKATTPYDEGGFLSIEAMELEQKRRDSLSTRLIGRIDLLESEKKVEIKRHIGKAIFYTREAREYDDQLALVKLKKYQDKAKLDQENGEIPKELQADEPKNVAEVLNNFDLRMEVFNNLNELKEGYYLILGTFEEASERDPFVIKLINSGDTNSSFFFNVNALSYYVYSDFFETKEEILIQSKRKIGEPNYEKMFGVKVERQ